MAKFCSKCGAPLEEGARFCVMCGAKVETSVPAEEKANTVAFETPVETASFIDAQPDLPVDEDVINIPYINKQVKKADVIKYGKLAGIVAGAVLVFTLMVSILFPSPKSAAKKFAKAMEKCDAEAVVKLMPDFYFVDDYYDYDDVVDELDDILSEVDELSMDLKEVEKLSNKEIKELEGMLELVELFADDFNADDVKDYRKATLKMKAVVDGGKENETVEIFIVKYNGKWKVIPDSIL